MLALSVKLLVLSESNNLVTIFYLLRSPHSMYISTFLLMYINTYTLNIKYILFISTSVKAIPLRAYSIH